MADIPNDLELNQEDFSDVLPRLPDDLQDFDLFEGSLARLPPAAEVCLACTQVASAGFQTVIKDLEKS